MAALALGLLAPSATTSFAATTGSLTGTVTGAITHTPVFGACVTAYDTSSALSEMIVTDGAGQYTLPGLPPGTYKVGFAACSAGNYLPQYYNDKPSLAAADPVTVTAGSTTSGIDAALQTGAQITGTVTDAVTHAAVAGECVAAYDATSNYVTSTQTDAGGKYTLAGLATGTYKIGFQSCGGANYLPQFYNGKPSLAAADPVNATAGSTTSGIDAALQLAGQITGTVTDATTHAPLQNACVVAYDTSDQQVGPAFTDAAGHYTISALPTGTYRVEFLSCGAGNYLPQFYNDKPSLTTADPIAVTAGSTTSGIDAALRGGGQVTGTVTDAATHAPVANECVTVYDSSGRFVGPPARSDANGTYTVSGLATGSYKVGFQSCAGGSYLSQFYNGKPSLAAADPVTVTAGSTTSGIDAALQIAGQITGTVTDAATHAALAGECVAAFDASGGYVSSTQTDSTGKYTLGGLSSGSYKVGFQSCGAGTYLPQFYNGKPSLMAADPVTVTAGSTTSGIDAALQPAGAITGTVTDAATHAALASVCITAYDTADRPVGWGFTDAAGHYTVSSLPGGTYKVKFDNCGPGNYVSQFYNGKPSLATADPVRVTAGSSTSGIDAALAPGGAITGTVTDANTHAAVPNVCVTAYDTAGSPLGSWYTDGAGHYTIAPLPSGSYRVGFQSCYGGNYAPQFYNDKPSLATADSISVTAPNTTPGIDAALQTGGQISGTVKDSVTHSAVSGECVSAYDASDNIVAGASTDATGTYTLSGLGTGSYKVGFGTCGGGGYLPQFYNGKPTLTAADPVAVTVGSTTSGIDADLQSGGRITGTVTDASTHAPLDRACVGLFDLTGKLLFGVLTNSSGAYTLSGISTGTYLVGFASGGALCPYGGADYLGQYYNNKPTAATADHVNVTEGSTTSGIDAALSLATGPPNTPAAPTSNQALNHDGHQTISWTAVTDPDGDTIDHYVLQHERSDQSAFSDVATVSGTSYHFGADGAAEGEGTWRYRVIAVDSHGTTSTPSDPSTPVVVDETKPNAPAGATTPAAAYTDPATGEHWYKDTVTVSFHDNGDPKLADGSPGSGVASATAAQVFDSSNVDPSTGAFAIDGLVTDKAGNVSDPTTVTGKLDWQAPTASFTRCPRAVLLNSSERLRWTASDPVPSAGLASAVTGVKSLDARTVGPHTVRSPVPSDNVGHIGAAATCDYTVNYRFSGFLRPAVNPPGINAATAGRTYPVKWRLTDALGRSIRGLRAISSVTYKATACSAFATDPTGGLPAQGTLRLDLETGGYQFNWRTPAAGCYTLFLTLRSGQVFPAFFSLSKR